MKPTKLQWEDVIQFEEVKGYGQHIWKDEDKYYLVLEEGTVVSWLVVYELPQELFTVKISCFLVIKNLKCLFPKPNNNG